MVEAGFDFILPSAWLRQVWILNPGCGFLKFGFWMLDFCGNPQSKIASKM